MYVSHAHKSAQNLFEVYSRTSICKGFLLHKHIQIIPFFWYFVFFLPKRKKFFIVQNESHWCIFYRRAWHGDRAPMVTYNKKPQPPQLHKTTNNHTFCIFEILIYMNYFFCAVSSFCELLFYVECWRRFFHILWLNLPLFSKGLIKRTRKTNKIGSNIRDLSSIGFPGVRFLFLTSSESSNICHCTVRANRN